MRQLPAWLTGNRRRTAIADDNRVQRRHALASIPRTTPLMLYQCIVSSDCSHIRRMEQLALLTTPTNSEETANSRANEIRGMGLLVHVASFVDTTVANAIMDESVSA